MDVLYFLSERTRFLRYVYERASVPFVETKERIRAADPPYDNPPFDDSGEPAYLEEWQDADAALEFLGQACLSHLAASLRLYLDAAREEIGRFYRLPEGSGSFDASEAKRTGVLSANKTWFAQFEIRLEASGADLGLLEEILLTRNVAQHPDSIAFDAPRQRAADHRKFPDPFFLSEFERVMRASEGGPGCRTSAPSSTWWRVC